MLGLKRIDKYLFLRFIEVFLATFFICSFILLMQFLWRHINDIIGKGLDFDVLAQFFLYSWLSVVPLALPLAILLGSLMTFGNLGERLELLAMKAAGISLFRIMLSLMVFISMISVGAFFFSNNVLPVSQRKLWTLIMAIKQTSPELEIPTGEFYPGITGYNIYVKDKDNKRKILKDVMVYNFSNGFNNASVMVADSARMQMASDKTYLIINLYNGESFENLKKVEGENSTGSIPYRRESFGEKQIIISFNANFAKIDENVLKNDYISKNLTQLQRSIDSINLRVDSICKSYSYAFMRNHFFDRQTFISKTFKDSPQAKLEYAEKNPLYESLNPDQKKNAVSYALNQAKSVESDIENNRDYQKSEKLTGIRHGIEWHHKFTLSFACLIFFFIGAPLGAIIRKGGLGLPTVISVVLFIIYYIIDNTGYKLAREDVWPVWQGIWLSSFCLLPVGIFFTYKAAKDSPILNSETYLNIFRKIGSLFGKKDQEKE